MYKLDLHTHSVASPDGGISAEQYAHILSTNQLDVVAITDHNRIDFALEVRQKLGDRVIVGEEIMTTGGEIIGLYLTERIKPGLSPLETIKQIKDQDGIVYIPHPFENVRKGIYPATAEELVDYIDIMEICNGRALFQNRSAQAVIWAKLNHKIGAASSDAHGVRGIGKTYTTLKKIPSQNDILEGLLHGIPVTEKPGIRALLYPKYHRFRKKIKK